MRLGASVLAQRWDRRMKMPDKAKKGLKENAEKVKRRQKKWRTVCAIFTT
jgi:hypothetical protein